jgi:pilus assembly protein CpaC
MSMKKLKANAGDGTKEVPCRILLHSAVFAVCLLVFTSDQGLGQDAPAHSKLEDLSLKKTRKPSIIESMSRSEDVIEVTVGQSRTLVLDSDFDWGGDSDEVNPSVSISDPGIAEIVVLGARGIRLIGLRIGDTDLTITTGTGEVISLSIQVVVDVPLIQARMLQFFPDAEIRIGQLGRKLIVEGQARDAAQVQRITRLLSRTVSSSMIGAMSGGGGATGYDERESSSGGPQIQAGGAATGTGSGEMEIINLMQVPGPQQVMLKVQIAELNRTAYREIGSDFLFADNGSVFGTRITGGTSVAASGSGKGLTGSITSGAAGAGGATAFGILEGDGFQAFMSALRRNSVLKVLAEPNLVAMHGHRADFLAGGEFPVPVPQSGAGGGPPTITIEYKKFGVQLAFVPYILDGSVIRMEVDPEVSSIDFALGTEISGVQVPGLNTRRSHTTVEMKEGQTLAIAGLIQLELAGRSDRIPGMGDLPYIGPFFSNSTSERVEKELVVLVTPYLTDAISADTVGMLPGDDLQEPDDLEFFLRGQIESQGVGIPFRSTVERGERTGLSQRIQIEERYLQVPHGFSR